MALTPVNYTPHVWANGEEGGTPINATRLNEIEGGIYDGSLSINEIIEYLQTEVSITNDELYNGTYEGRNIAEIPEIQDELDQYGSIPAFLQARAQNLDSRYLRVGDWCYVNNTYMGDDWAYVIADFWPYLNINSNPGHIIMVPKTKPFSQTTAWRASGNNNGTSSNAHPYPTSDLFAFEASTILPTFSTAWQNAMVELSVYAEEKYSSSGKTDADGTSVITMGKIFSPSVMEVIGFDCYSSHFDAMGGKQFAYLRAPRNWIGFVGSLTRTTTANNSTGIIFFQTGRLSSSNRTTLRSSGSCFAIG